MVNQVSSATRKRYINWNSVECKILTGIAIVSTIGFVYSADESQAYVTSFFRDPVARSCKVKSKNAKDTDAEPVCDATEEPIVE